MLRRRFVAGSATALTAVLIGCLSTSNETGTDEGTNPDELSIDGRLHNETPDTQTFDVTVRDEEGDLLTEGEYAVDPTTTRRIPAVGRPGATQTFDVTVNGSETSERLEIDVVGTDEQPDGFVDIVYTESDGIGIWFTPRGEFDDDDDTGSGEDKEVVLYEELPEYDQRFVDEAFHYHNLRWITEDGDRTYIERSGNGWGETEDPLVPADVSSDLERVMSGEKHLKKDETRYSFLMDVGHGPYGRTYSKVSVAACEKEGIEFDDLSEELQDLLEFLIEEGELFIAEPEFENVSDADFFLPFDGELYGSLTDKFLAQERCLKYGNERYHIDIDSEALMNMEGYELLPVND